MTDAALAKIETPQAPAVVGETAALISMIERAARDPNVDIGKMERLFEMHERIEARRAEQAFNAAMAAAQAELEPVARGRKNEHTKSKYAELEAIYAMAKPIITKHGFGPTFGPAKADTPNHIKIVCDLAHAGGFSKRYEGEFPLDGAGLKGTSNKTDIQATGSSFTYARRYMTLLIFDIATKDDRDGNATDKTPPKANALDEIKALIAETSADLGWICNNYSIETLDDMTARQADHCKAGLLARKRAQQKAAKP